MISVLQQFFNITSFRFGIINARDGKEPEKSEQIEDDNLLHQLQRMFTFLQLSNRGDFTPTDFVYSFKDAQGLPTDYMIQCDASEFLSRFMEKIEESLKKTKYKYLMKGIFNGETCSQLLCMNGCGSIKNRFEELIYLSLEIKNVTTLKESLEKYISEEIIDDYFCEACKKKGKHTKRISINKLPNVLIIHLQRFAFNYETFLMEKINTKLEFPTNINLKDYCTETINDENTVAKEQPEYFNKVYNHSDDYYEYQLKGVVVHSGTGQYGHYYSFINTEMSRSGNDRWLRFNDSIVQKYNIKNLVEDTFGGSVKSSSKSADWLVPSDGWEESSKNAYMLVYERKMKTPILLLTEPTKNAIDIGDNIDQFLKEKDPLMKGSTNKSFLDCEDTAMSRKFEDTIYYVDNNVYKYKDEYIQLISYYADSRLNVHFDDLYYKEVLSDNIIFRNDHNVYRNMFMKFIAWLCKTLLEQADSIPDESLLKMFDTLNAIISTIVTRSSYKAEVSTMIPVLIDLLRKKPFLSKVIFDSFLNDKNRWMFSLIVTLDSKINSYFTNYLSESLKVVITEGKSSPLYTQAMTIVDYLYSLMPSEITKYWTKMLPYLDIFDSICKENTISIIEMMMEKETIGLMGDFFLGKDSPFLGPHEKRNEVGNKTVAAKFAPIISTISLLIRHSKNLVGKVSPLYLPTQEEKVDKEKSEPLAYELSEKAKKLLECDEFFKKAFKGNYDNVAMSKMLAHLMYEDIEFTRKILFFILEEIESAKEVTEIKEAFNLIFNILKIKDSFTQFRLETIFGLPSIDFPAEKYDLKGNVYIRYISPLYPKKTTLLEKNQIRLRGSIDYIKIISFLYGLIYSSPDIFRYFNSIPHPKINGHKLYQHIESLAKTEIEHLKSIKAESRFENSIELVLKCISEYKEKEAAFKEAFENDPMNEGMQWEINFMPNLKINKIVKETIINVPNEFCNQQNIYLLRCELEAEATNPLPFNEKEDGEEIKEFIQKYESYPPRQENNETLKLFKEKITYNPDENSSILMPNAPPNATGRAGSEGDKERDKSGVDDSKNEKQFSFYVNLVSKIKKQPIFGDIDNMIEMNIKKEEEKKLNEKNEEGVLMVKYYGKIPKKNETLNKKGSMKNLNEQTEKLKEDEYEKNKVQEEAKEEEEVMKEDFKEEEKKEEDKKVENKEEELKEKDKKMENKEEEERKEEERKEEEKNKEEEAKDEEKKEEQKKEEIEKEMKIEPTEEDKKDELKIEEEIEIDEEESKKEKNANQEDVNMNQVASSTVTQLTEASSIQIKEGLQENIPTIIKLRRYILANPSEVDYKAIIQITSKCLSYSCSSEYIRYVKAGSHEQVVVLPIIEKEGESDEYYEDTVIINVEIVDMSNMDNFQRVGTVKKSKSVEMFSDSANAKPVVSLSDPEKGDEQPKQECSSDAIEILCPSCQKSNYIGDKDSYHCKYCKGLLLE